MPCLYCRGYKFMLDQDTCTFSTYDRPRSTLSILAEFMLERTEYFKNLPIAPIDQSSGISCKAYSIT